MRAVHEVFVWFGNRSISSSSIRAGANGTARTIKTPTEPHQLRWYVRSVVSRAAVRQVLCCTVVAQRGMSSSERPPLEPDMECQHRRACLDDGDREENVRNRVDYFVLRREEYCFRRGFGWRLCAFLVLMHAFCCEGMTLKYPDGTNLASGAAIIPQGRRVLLGLGGEYAAGLSIKRGDAISIIISTANCAESDDISSGISMGVASKKVYDCLCLEVMMMLLLVIGSGAAFMKVDDCRLLESLMTSHQGHR